MFSKSTTVNSNSQQEHETDSVSSNTANLRDIFDAEVLNPQQVSVQPSRVVAPPESVQIAEAAGRNLVLVQKPTDCLRQPVPSAARRANALAPCLDVNVQPRLVDNNARSQFIHIDAQPQSVIVDPLQYGSSIQRHNIHSPDSSVQLPDIHLQNRGVQSQAVQLQTSRPTSNSRTVKINDFLDECLQSGSSASAHTITFVRTMADEEIRGPRCPPPENLTVRLDPLTGRSVVRTPTAVAGPPTATVKYVPIQPTVHTTVSDSVIALKPFKGKSRDTEAENVVIYFERYIDA